MSKEVVICQIWGNISRCVVMGTRSAAMPTKVILPDVLLTKAKAAPKAQLAQWKGCLIEGCLELSYLNSCSRETLPVILP